MLEKIMGSTDEQSIMTSSLQNESPGFNFNNNFIFNN